eukprot:m.180596 g.180596  ORF g.180596 m.180596 type:complete len:171 (-) comp14653_c0_seq29:2300-2812(-)
MIETHESVSDFTAKVLLQQWKRYWDLSKHYLVEKSPRHTTMTRYLQGLYKNHSKFLVMLRHPLGSTRKHWQTTNAKAQQKTCAYEPVENWVVMHEILAEDIKHLDSVAVVQFEMWLKNGTVEQWEQVLCWKFLEMGLAMMKKPDSLFCVVYLGDSTAMCLCNVWIAVHRV